ncbi:MAG: xanthine dehydrogenase family protein molybdopterin-binding subunit [Alphaproteobacteria bacterium]|nr:xanthine dehydrogenase family protein molybdopterin-binding subunit [Alphaproteobacteria bacterium]
MHFLFDKSVSPSADKSASQSACGQDNATQIETSRRTILKSIGGIGAGLVLGMHIPSKARAQSGAAAVIKGGSQDAVFAPNAFVRIAPDSTVTVMIKHIEFGQGPYTGLSTLVAEELDADWSQMRAQSAPANAALYKNLFFGVQGTGGSTAMANSYLQMRKAGAAARAMLIEAAANAWGVPEDEITISKGVISHKTAGKSGSFGDFAEAAAKLTPPAEPFLKDPGEFVLIGKKLPKLDSLEKSTGKAEFTMDASLPGMLTVLIQRPPLFGAKVKSVDDSNTRKVPGVVDVKTLPSGVAVYGEGFWAAKKGRDALSIEWDETGAEKRSTDQIVADFQKSAAATGQVVTNVGDVEKTIGSATRTLEAEYVFPYLAHAPMEPLDCLIEATDRSAKVWAGSQMPTIDQAAIAQTLGLRPEEVDIQSLFAGGSFGRRATPIADVAYEAAAAVKAIDRSRPVKVVFTREDDIQGGFYRPLFVHKMKAALDESGNIAGWDHVLVGQSIMEGTPFEGMIKNGVDPTMVEGAEDLPYAIPNMRVSFHKKSFAVTPLWWRSVGHTHTAYATETFLDELFALAGKDPVAERLRLLGDKHQRLANVLTAVAESADWGSAVPEGRARGVALHKSFSSYVAQIAEVSAGDEDGIPRVHKVWCAVDCGVPVNPDIINAQMEGGIGYGLGHILYAGISLDKGRVVQSNFDTYRSLRINEMPEVEVEIYNSTEPPTGVGEPGVPPIGPAVANAWAKLTGKRVRQLPFAGLGA